MYIALGTLDTKDFDIDGNMEKMLTMMDQANDVGCDYIFFGEAALNGFDGLHWNFKKDLDYATNLNSSLISKIRQEADKSNTGIGFGYIEEHLGQIYSSYLIIDKDGDILSNYRRLTPGWRVENPTPQYKYREGLRLGRVNLEGRSFDIAICGDLWTEEVIDMIKDSYSEAIIWPLFVGKYSEEEWKEKGQKKYCEQVKSIGKKTFFINSVETKEKGALGNSMVIDSSGKLLSQYPLREKGFLKVEV